ncbi:5-oxoprolinase subunit B/C family protein [Nocardioides korecus]
MASTRGPDAGPPGLRLSAYGEGGVLVTVRGPDPDQRWRTTQALATALRADRVPGLVDVVATYDSLLLTHDPGQTTAAALGERVRTAYAGLPAAAASPPAAPRVVEVPVLFGGDAGPDLVEVAAELGTTAGELVDRLADGPWTVRFVASPVGSPFAERDDWEVSVPRLGSPRAAVPPGSVALSGAQAMVYPVASPGGWRLVGRTPVPLVALSPAGPRVPYAAGDLLRLVPVDRTAYVDLAPARRPTVADATPTDATPTPHVRRASTCRHDGPPVLRVREAGRATLQDLGRPGLGHLGVAVHGASDRGSAVLANLLVGNPPGAPLLEVTASGVRLRAGADLLVAGTGAPLAGAPPTGRASGAPPSPAPRVDGVPVPVAEPVVLRAGSVLELPAPTTGLRTYLAVAGGLGDPGGAGSAGTLGAVAGSVSPDAGLGVGGLLGRGDALVAGACVCGWRQPHGVEPPFRFDGARLGGAGTVAPGAARWVTVTAGPERDRFDAATLLGPWTVGAASNHVGLRLEGPVPRRVGAPDGEARSRGVPVGAVEVPPHGGLLALLPGRLVTAGYPVPLVATSLALDVLGQARPGDRLLLREVTLEEALEARRRRATAYADLARRVRTALTAGGLAHLVGVSDPEPRW